MLQFCYNIPMTNQETPQPPQKLAVAYYRVSTQKQGTSGLGLEAQVSAVADYADRQGLEIVQEFTEIETGTSKRARPQIVNAIAKAKELGAVLVIAKLDRLARNVAFLSNLMETGVNFVACDNPNATTFTLHILAAVAEHEAKMISERTKAALRATKARGTKLGTPENLTEDAKARGRMAQRQAALAGYSKLVIEKIVSLRESGMGFSKVAKALNELGETTRKGKPFQAMTVKRIVERLPA